jgi:6-pyruvoyltetrahydropterin/6-carboxytetrahydropterin synthase
VDFKEIKSATRQIALSFDHHYLNEIPPFTRLNPTAENLAAYFFQALAESLNDDRIKVKAVTVWETDRAQATYTED